MPPSASPKPRCARQRPSRAANNAATVRDDASQCGLATAHGAWADSPHKGASLI